MKNIPWVDKYRPKKLDDIVYQNDVVKMFKKSVETNDLPHLLLYGPPGTGKTSSVLAMAREMFKTKAAFKEGIKELNASEDRGIKIVREKITAFAKFAVNTKNGPPFKIIILDEADAMTVDAQSALRKIIETYSKVTRFCFICNYPNKIIKQIHSRCVSYRYSQIDDGEVFKKLDYINRQENLNLTNDMMEMLVKHCHGDLRKGITMLQTTKYIPETIKLDDIYELCGYISKNLINRITEICIVNKHHYETNDIIQLAKQIKSHSYPIQNILIQINDLIVANEQLDDIKKATIISTLSDVDKCVTDGCSEFIQLTKILYEIYDS